MGEKIIVAGAGHAGLVAAALLSRSGYDVSVYEKQPEGALGHDWEDRFSFELLSEITGREIPRDFRRFRGDCAFISPSHRTKVVIRYDNSEGQEVSFRKPLIKMLLDFATDNGVKIHYGTAVTAPICENGRVTGIKTENDDVRCDLVIDAAGVFSPIRTKLDDSFGIDKELRRGDVFYAYRAYFDKSAAESPDTPFEVYLYHECEQGLSWFCTNEDSVDVLIGRIDPLTDEKVEQQLNIFRKNHPWLGERILHGGQYAVIPVRRPLDVMVADGYAAAGDSAFMTTPMNGMGIDLSLLAGRLLANTIIENGKCTFSREELWAYNRDFHRLFGGNAAKNEGLKNSLLHLPACGVDFLFDSAVIEASDLAGAGKSTSLSALAGKFFRGMKKPAYFFAIVNGLIKGSKACRTYKSAPQYYNEASVRSWRKKISDCTIAVG